MALTIEQIQTNITNKTDAREIINQIADYIQANPGGGGGSSYLPLDLTDDVEVALNGHALEYLGSKIKEEHDDTNGIWYAEGLTNSTQFYLDDLNFSTYTQSGNPDYASAVGLVYTNANSIDGLAQLYAQTDENNWAQFDVNGSRIRAQSTADFSIEADTGFRHSTPPATTAALLLNGQISFYLDEVGNKLKVAVKYSDGTSKTGEIALV